MGWTFTPGWNRKDLINDCTKGWDLHAEDNTVIGRCNTLKWCTVGNVLWSVCETRITAGPKAGKADRWIRCDILSNGGVDGWGCKTMEESMGPNYYTCPPAYLDMVPCPDSEYARDWREIILNKAKEVKNQHRLLKSLRPGDKVFLKNSTPNVFRYDGGKGTRHHISFNEVPYRLPIKRIDVERTLAALEEKYGLAPK